MSNNKTEETVEAAIYKGFFWKIPLSEVAAQKPLRRLNAKQIEGIQNLLKEEQHKDDGYRGQGIPDRTLILPQQKIRIFYGGSMGAEIGVHGLHGDGLQSIFHSEKFLRHLNQIEGFGISLKLFLITLLTTMFVSMLLGGLLIFLLESFFQ